MFLLKKKSAACFFGRKPGKLIQKAQPKKKQPKKPHYGSELSPAPALVSAAEAAAPTAGSGAKEAGCWLLWKMDDVQKRCLRYESAGDQLVGRIAAGLIPTSSWSCSQTLHSTVD
jgi:hypothetical protein